MSMNKNWLILVDDTVHLFILLTPDNGITCTFLTGKSDSLCAQPTA
jgi:hypothetical protein